MQTSLKWLFCGVDRDHQVAFLVVLNLWDDVTLLSTLDFEELKELGGIWREHERSRERLAEFVG